MDPGRFPIWPTQPGSEADRLRDEIAEKLTGLTDPETGTPAVKQAYNSTRVYKGPYKSEAPDIIAGYTKGYRVSWEAAVGQVTDKTFHDNTKAWSGDHCIDHSLVPGVLFCNRIVNTEKPRLMDIGPTVLDMFGLKVPAYMDGRPLAEMLRDGGQAIVTEAVSAERSDVSQDAYREDEAALVEKRLKDLGYM